MPQDFFTTKTKIVKAMQKADRPLILQHIAKATKLTPQLVSYHMKQMIECGIAGIYPVEQDLGNIYYTLQPAYYDKKWLDALFVALTPFVEEMGKNIDADQAKVDTSVAVIRNLSMFLRLFEDKIQKLDLKEQLKQSLT
jgi:DNA-binding MarR family transcriptional regulator